MRKKRRRFRAEADSASAWRADSLSVGYWADSRSAGQHLDNSEFAWGDVSPPRFPASWNTQESRMASVEAIYWNAQATEECLAFA